MTADGEFEHFRQHVAAGRRIQSGAREHRFMHEAAQEALSTTAELNTSYRTPEEVRALLTRLTGRPVDDTVTVFPPLYSEFGKNLTLGKNVFINMGCAFRTRTASPSATGR